MELPPLPQPDVREAPPGEWSIALGFLNGAVHEGTLLQKEAAELQEATF